ncbi:MAG: hypothetical protein ACK53Y_07385, partial [bacterium]
MRETKPASEDLTSRTTGAEGRNWSGLSRKLEGPPSPRTILAKTSAARPLARAASSLPWASTGDAARPLT